MLFSWGCFNQSKKKLDQFVLYSVIPWKRILRQFEFPTFCNTCNITITGDHGPTRLEGNDLSV